MKTSLFAGIILAGGNSTRMGTNKKDLILEGVTMLERTINVLDPLVSQIIVVLKASEKGEKHFCNSNEKIVIAYDSISNQGPLQGIVDGLDYLRLAANHIFLLTCDLPYLTGDWLSNLKKQYLKLRVDGVVTSVDGFTNPLIALYHKKVLNYSRQLMAEGKKRPLDLWEKFNVRPIDINRENQQIVQDMNTPEAYQKACLYYKETAP
ncbi:MAG: molybdenum cofactor guanylyltransferase [Deltaproteobacteria bacterium]|jgi:molybdenum cofactor guanylyltransferase|nr:molybdenum cofactor guanylyltransferase [Deltaproteobacteria bacterium]